MRVFYSFHEIFSFNSYLNIVSALMEKEIWQKILFKKRKWWSISQYNHAIASILVKIGTQGFSMALNSNVTSQTMACKRYSSPNSFYHYHFIITIHKSRFRKMFWITSKMPTVLPIFVSISVHNSNSSFESNSCCLLRQSLIASFVRNRSAKVKKSEHFVRRVTVLTSPFVVV